MIVKNVKVYDLEESLKASKYPMSIDTNECNDDWTNTIINLAQCKPGTGHDQFLTGIRVAFDVTFSIKAWTEAQRYNFFDFVSSQSTMHCVTKFDIKKQCNEYVWYSTIERLKRTVDMYNSIEDKNCDGAKELKLEILYNIPVGFKLTARITTNYRQLKTIYHQRKTHELPDWKDFCKFIETLPYAELLITRKA